MQSSQHWVTGLAPVVLCAARTLSEPACAEKGEVTRGEETAPQRALMWLSADRVSCSLG